MSDIASLVLSLDSSPIVAGTAALNSLTAAAKPAADAAAALENAAKGLSATMTAAGAGAAVASAGMTGASNGVRELAVAAKPAAAAMAELQATMSAYVADQQVLSVAQRNGTTANGEQTESIRGQRLVLRGLATDLAVFGTGVAQTAGLAATLFIENEHLFSGFSGLKNAVGGLLTPTNLLIGAFAGLVVGGYEAITTVVAQEKALDDLSARTDETLQSIHGLEAAAAFKGINTSDFTKGMEQFQTQVETASSGLNELFRGNHLDDSGGLKDSLLQLGDLIKNAGDESTKYKLMQEAGLPATAQWVALLSQGSAGIKTAADNFHALGDATDQNLINKARAFDEAWNKSWKNFTDNAKSAVIETAGWFDQLGPKISGAVVGAAGLWSAAAADAVQHQIAAALIATGRGSALTANSDVGQFYKGLGHDGTQTGPNGKPTTPTVDTAAQKAEIASNQQLLSLLGPLASIQQTIAQKENDITLARLANVTVTKAQHDAIIAYAEAQALGITQIHSQTDALGVQSASFGMLTGQAAAFTAVQTKINEANRTGNPLTAQQVALLQNEAAALGDATERLYEMNTANEALSSGFKTFRTDMENGTSAWTALKDAAMTALNSIADKLIDMASKNLVAAAFGGSSGSGSLLSAITGLLSGKSGAVVDPVTGLHDGGMVGTDATFSRYVHPAYFDDAPRFHDGGIAGDEVPIIAKAGEGVFTPAQMAALAPVGGSNAQPPVSVNVYQTNDFRGTDPSSIARINAALVQTKNQAVSESVNAILKLQKNAPGVARPS